MERPFVASRHGFNRKKGGRLPLNLFFLGLIIMPLVTGRTTFFPDELLCYGLLLFAAPSLSVRPFSPNLAFFSSFFE
ncbi:MAG TPA: hypothetical protein VFS25_06145 [Chitinophaga sp.]|uniref:hypothetical protein n=1 Tax=Chitinophaga sp. TaxID=1869181 RepID=UPI002DBC87F9|nr:hypothetical protein [Chitinophaga sp.]HEU4552391.1 hypothetical protein [Chitinophaga sp.]